MILKDVDMWRQLKFKSSLNWEKAFEYFKRFFFISFYLNNKTMRKQTRDLKKSLETIKGRIATRFYSANMTPQQSWWNI